MQPWTVRDCARRTLTGLAPLLLAASLAGCETTTGTVGLTGPRIAEVETPDASFKIGRAHV